MSGWIDRIIADGLSRAGGQLAEEQRLGRLVWSRGGFRCYERQEAEGGVLTICGPGSELRYELVGVSLADLS